MARFGRPPVNEVVISVSFEPQPCLTGPQLFVTLAKMFENFPTIEEQPPYEMPTELPTEEQVAQPSGTAQFRLMTGVGAPERRFWLTEKPGSPLLVQVQSGYFALNWRRRPEKGDSEYPGFDALRARFMAQLADFEQAAIRRGGGSPLQVRGIELTYINVLTPDAVWSTHVETNHVLRISAPALEGADQVNIAYSREMQTASGDFLGRIHASVQTAYRLKTEERPVPEFKPVRSADLDPIINISLTARSGSLEKDGAHETLERFLDLAHDQETAAFRSLVTDSALEHWGLND